jgi:NDP-sugar pyrophosphorylase family protein
MPTAIDAIVLCGGAGLRLRSVTGDAPKSLASIGGRPFLEILFHQLRRHGFQRAILAVGFQGDVIRSHFGSRADGLALNYSIETEPLGTGGALRSAADYLETDHALILNGDSYTDADLPAFTEDARKANADISILLVPVDGRVDCGLVSVDANHRVLGFKEKQAAHGTQYVNAGVYVATKRLLRGIQPEVRISLETDLFPKWLAEGKQLRGFNYPGKCIDIGTPERFQDAQESLANAELGGALSSAEGRAV